MKPDSGEQKRDRVRNIFGPAYTANDGSSYNSVDQVLESIRGESVGCHVRSNEAWRPRR